MSEGAAAAAASSPAPVMQKPMVEGEGDSEGDDVDGGGSDDDDDDDDDGWDPAVSAHSAFLDSRTPSQWHTHTRADTHPLVHQLRHTDISTCTQLHTVTLSDPHTSSHDLISHSVSSTFAGSAVGRGRRLGRRDGGRDQGGDGRRGRNPTEPSRGRGAVEEVYRARQWVGDDAVDLGPPASRQSAG
jgi:hypothetical protein